MARRRNGRYTTGAGSQYPQQDSNPPMFATIRTGSWYDDGDSWRTVHRTSESLQRSRIEDARCVSNSPQHPSSVIYRDGRTPKRESRPLCNRHKDGRQNTIVTRYAPPEGFVPIVPWNEP